MKCVCVWKREYECITWKWLGNYWWKSSRLHAGCLLKILKSQRPGVFPLYHHCRADFWEFVTRCAHRRLWPKKNSNVSEMVYLLHTDINSVVYLLRTSMICRGLWETVRQFSLRIKIPKEKRLWETVWQCSLKIISGLAYIYYVREPVYLLRQPLYKGRYIEEIYIYYHYMKEVYIYYVSEPVYLLRQHSRMSVSWYTQR